MINVKKRDGQIVEFELAKIEVAIEKAFKACHKEYTKEIIELLALKVTSSFNEKVVNGVVSVEDIQDSVEYVLIQAGYVDVAKSYIVYRKQHENLRQIKNTNLDYAHTVNDYLKINAEYTT